MAWNWFRKKSYQTSLAPTRIQGDTPPVQDTRAAIEELSQVVKNDPEAVEIYLALGNLYRSQGEIERAIQVRNSLIVRPGLDNRFKARAWFELGRDFRRGGFLDRSAHAFQEARSLGHDPLAIRLEMAKLAAERGNYEEAAESFDRLNLPLQRAHYLYRQGVELIAEGHGSRGLKALKLAVKAHPGAIEAWQELLVQAYKGGHCSKVVSLLRESLDSIPPALRFVPLEQLRQAMVTAQTQNDPTSTEWAKACDPADLAKGVVAAVDELEPDMLLYYYAVLFLLLGGDVESARDWLDKTLVLEPDFWLARLELFALTRSEQSLTPVFETQLDYFMDRAREVRRFFCSACGLKRDHIFYKCPRCHSWHSIVFRTDFSQ